MLNIGDITDERATTRLVDVLKKLFTMLPFFFGMGVEEAGCSVKTLAFCPRSNGELEKRRMHLTTILIVEETFYLLTDGSGAVYGISWHINYFLGVVVRVI